MSVDLSKLHALNSALFTTSLGYTLLSKCCDNILELLSKSDASDPQKLAEGDTVNTVFEVTQCVQKVIVGICRFAVEVR
jgi:hypothetical protein